MQKTIIVFLFTAIYFSISAQTAYFILPGHQGESYSVSIYQGEISDTIENGFIPENETLKISFPEEYKDYAGIAKLNFGKKSILVVVNNENFVVDLINNQLKFSNSKENDLIQDKFKQKDSLTNKVNFLYEGIDLFPNNNRLLLELYNEFSIENHQYIQYRNELKNKKTYAAKYLQINDFINGYADSLYTPLQKEENFDALTRFFRYDLDIDVLYTSGLWEQVNATIFKILKSPEQYADVMIEKLKQAKTEKAFDYLADRVMFTSSFYGWINAEDKISSYLANSGRIDPGKRQFFRVFELANVQKGTVAPSIEGLDSLNSSLSNCLLMFFDTGCHACEEQLQMLKNYYYMLNARGIRVVTMASDLNKNVYEIKSADFPWNDKLCDFKGLDGTNFRNYAINATPTFYLIDYDGKISGRFTRLQDTGLIN